MLRRLPAVIIFRSIVIAVVFGSVTFAQQSPPNGKGNWKPVDQVIEALQQVDKGSADILVQQSELDKLIADSGGDASTRCGL